MEGAPRVVPAVAVPAFEAPPAQAGASAIAAPPLLPGSGRARGAGGTGRATTERDE